MSPTILQILLLGLIQGAAELLPVSSSAHVIVAEKLMGLDPSSPAMTFLLVMLHTGTMFAVIAYFWPAWRAGFFSSCARFESAAGRIVLASFFTGVVYLSLKELIEKVFLRGHAKAEVEQLFSNLWLVAGGLAAAGILILVSAKSQRQTGPEAEVSLADSIWIGLVQGLCLPFRGFSRSGATISVGLIRGVGKVRAEEFSFALAVVLTPAAIAQELLRLRADRAESGGSLHLGSMVAPGLVGMVGSFVAGLLALRLLSRCLQHSRWQDFGYYCLVAAVALVGMAACGY
jgi:undecaprenyl-diphosphatase